MSSKKVHTYFVTQCGKCSGRAIHFTQYDVLVELGCISNPPKRKFLRKQTIDMPNVVGIKISNSVLLPGEERIKDSNGNELELDELFYMSRPSAGLILEKEIPERIRKYLNEADEGRRQNHLTGASAALRKAIYKMLKHQNIPEADIKTGKLISYNDRLDMIKQKCKHVESEYLDQLKQIQSMTSIELHENDWDEFDSNKLRLLIEITVELLWEIYVIPARKEKKRQELLNLSENARMRKPSTDE